MFLSSLITKKLKSQITHFIENNGIKKNKYLFLFLFFIFPDTEMPKFWQNSGTLCRKKNIIKTDNFCIFSNYYVQNSKVNVNMGKINDFFRNLSQVFFSLLGTKTINNKEAPLYWNPKQNY